MAKFSDAQIEPLEGHLQIDGEMIKTHAEVACQVACVIQDPSWPRSTRIYATRQPFQFFVPSKQNLDSSHPLGPPVTLHDLGPVVSQLSSSFSLSFHHSYHQYAAKKWAVPSNQATLSRGEAVVIDEDVVHAADGNGNGDAKVALKRPLKRGESTDPPTADCGLNGWKNRVGKRRW